MEDLRWLVMDFGPAYGVVNAAWVQAGDSREAAEAGRERLRAENPDDFQEYCDTVAVVAVHRDGEPAIVWFEFVARLCEHQCCGGNPHTVDGHTATCPERP